MFKFAKKGFTLISGVNADEANSFVLDGGTINGDTAVASVDASKCQDAFGTFGTTPHREAVERAVAWFRRHDGV